MWHAVDGALLLNREEGHPKDTGFNSLKVEARREGLIVFDGWSHHDYYDISESNNFGGGSVAIPSDAALEGLACWLLGDSWSYHGLSLGNGYVKIGSGSSYDPDVWLSMPASRSSLLLLDVHEHLTANDEQARTGTKLPTAVFDRAFLAALREHPSWPARMGGAQIHRSVVALLREAHGYDVEIEHLSDDLMLARRAGGSAGAMLVAVHSRRHEVVDLHLVDRINGVRDRNSLTKSVLVSRSGFTCDVGRSYGGLSERMELVDFDRLQGLLLDSGWIAQQPGLLTCPVDNRPSCVVFISYSHADREKSVGLYNKLHGWGYQCVLDQVDLYPGDVILTAIDQAIAAADVVLLCLSATALASNWVQHEIRAALSRELQERRTILIPVDLDGAVHRSKGHAAQRLRTRIIADLSRWHPEDIDSSELRLIRAAIDGQRTGL